MSYRLEHALNPWVNFLIMPIFAIANAGVEIPGLSYLNFFQYTPEIGSVGIGIYLGLLLGKPVGITFASWLAIKLKDALCGGMSRRYRLHYVNLRRYSLIRRTRP